MPIPQNVNPHNFRVNQIVYNDDEFSIALGKWEDDTMRIAMRWNGENDDAGYPKTFGNPVWFVLPDNLSIPILRGILGVKYSDIKAIIKAIDKISDSKCFL